MNTLYDIKNRFVELMNNDELTEEEVNELGQVLATELQNKSTNIVAYDRNINSWIDSLKNEIDRLTAMKKALEEKHDRFKEYVKSNMEQLGLKKIETELGSLSITKNPVSVEIISVADVPSEYKQEVVTTKIDKRAIAQWYKDTGEIPKGCSIIDNKTSLRIK